MRHLRPVAVAIAIATLPITVAGHNFGPKRNVVFEESKSELLIYMVYSEPPGERTERLLAMYDTDGNGRLNRNESKLAVPEMRKRALNGLKFSRPIDWGQADVRIRYNRRSGMSVALLVSTELKFVSVFLPNTAGNVPLAVLGKGPNVRVFLDSTEQVAAFTVPPGFAGIVRVEQNQK